MEELHISKEEYVEEGVVGFRVEIEGGFRSLAQFNVSQPVGQPPIYPISRGTLAVTSKRVSVNGMPIDYDTNRDRAIEKAKGYALHFASNYPNVRGEKWKVVDKTAD